MFLQKECTIGILVMYARYHIVDKIVQFALKRFRIFSNSFNFRRLGTPIINERTGAPVLCCHGKSSSYIPTFKVIRTCSYGYISLKKSNAFKSSIFE